MKILVVNPNSTVSMTEKIGLCAMASASPGVEITAVCPNDAPKSIEGHFDEAMCLRGLLREVQQGEVEGHDAFLIACFDDTGIGACREVASGPVIGICEAAMHAATSLAHNFSIVTTLPRSVPIVEDLVVRYGKERMCRNVRAADIPVLDLEINPDAKIKVLDEIHRAIEEDHCESVILGCAGMADLTAWLTEESGVPVIDGVVFGVRLLEALVGAGLKTSKIGTYAPPRAK